MTAETDHPATPTRTLKAPSSSACHVTSVPVSGDPIRVSETESTTTVGAVVSFTTLVVCEPSLLAVSVTQTRIVLAPSLRSPALTVVMCWAGAPV